MTRSTMMARSLLSTFFETKKVEAKTQFCASINAFLDDLFEQMHLQIQQLLKLAEIDSPPMNPPPIDALPTCLPVANPIIDAEKDNYYLYKNLNTNVNVIETINGNKDTQQNASENASTRFLQTPVYAIKSKPSAISCDSSKRFSPKRNNSNVSISAETNNGDRFMVCETEAPSSVLSMNDIERSQQQCDKKNKKRRSTNTTTTGTSEDNIARKKYSCTESNCNKSFPTIYHLNNHQRSHNGVKPYRCKWPNCTYASGIRSHVLRHVRETHFRRSLGGGKCDQSGSMELSDPKVYLEIDQQLLS